MARARAFLGDHASTALTKYLYDLLMEGNHGECQAAYQCAALSVDESVKLAELTQFPKENHDVVREPVTTF